MKFIAVLVVWTIIGIIVIYSLFREVGADTFNDYSDVAKLFVVVGDPICWIAFIYGVILGLVQAIIIILNRGKR